jgi:hypothetical protein
MDMKKLFWLFALISVPLFASSQNRWKDLVVTDDTEVYIDPSNVYYEPDGCVHAIIKTVYTTPKARERYVNKIKRAFPPKDIDKKIAKWQEFSYTITNGIYDCEHKRFKIVQIEDYRFDDSLIFRTKTKPDKAKWLLVDIDTVGDHVLYYICDYENR